MKEESEVKTESPPDNKEEKKISAPPSPAPRSLNTSAPLLNGDADPAGKKGELNGEKGHDLNVS